MQIDFGNIDPASLIISLIALWVAWKEIKRNRSVCLLVEEFVCRSSQNVRVDNGKSHHRLQIVMRNQGIALHDAHAVLTFRTVDGGWVTIPFLSDAECGVKTGEFACGMVWVQALDTASMHEHSRKALLELKDVWMHDPQIIIYSQGYRCKKICVVTWQEKLRRLWNEFAWWVNAKIPLKRFTDKLSGKTFVKVRGLPTARVYSWQIECFLRELKGYDKAEMERGSG